MSAVQSSGRYFDLLLTETNLSFLVDSDELTLYSPQELISRRKHEGPGDTLCRCNEARQTGVDLRV